MNLVKSTKWMKHFHAGEIISLSFPKDQANISITNESVHTTESLRRIKDSSLRSQSSISVIFTFFNLAAFLKSSDLSWVFKLCVSWTVANS